MIWFIGGMILGLVAWDVFFWFKMKRALGFRADWKRRFDKMKETLGL